MILCEESIDDLSLLKILVRFEMAFYLKMRCTPQRHRAASRALNQAPTKIYVAQIVRAFSQSNNSLVPCSNGLHHRRHSRNGLATIISHRHSLFAICDPSVQRLTQPKAPRIFALEPPSLAPTTVRKRCAAEFAVRNAQDGRRRIVR